MNSIKLKSLSIVALVALTLTSCTSEKAPEVENEVVDNHTSENSLDWQGTYSANLPCADCEYIETELSLNADMKYELITQHIGREKSFPDTVKGSFKWEGNNVKLDGIKKNDRPSTYKVEENQLRQLDLEGNKIEGDLAQNYVMRKHGNLNVEDKTWQLVELNGKKIKGSPETHYLVFHSKDGRFEAKADCNFLSGSYKIKNELQLSTEAGLTTLMACPGNLEKEFSEMLYSADNISVNDKTLTLNKARMAPLARFELVEK